MPNPDLYAAVVKARNRAQWRDALQPLPKIFDWYSAHAFVGTVLAAAFLIVKGYVVARGDLATALGILQYAGLSSVVIAGLLSSLPILTAAMLAYVISRLTLYLSARIVGASRVLEPRPLAPIRTLVMVMLGAFVLSAVFTPWTYLVSAAVIGLVIGLMRAWTERMRINHHRRRWARCVPEWVARLIFVALAGFSVIPVILMLYAVWLPHEIVTFQPHTLSGGGTVEIGYVLSEDNGWITMLSTGQEKHAIIRARDAEVIGQEVCERLPYRQHPWSEFFDAVTLWRETSLNSYLGASSNPRCPYQGI